MKSRLIPLALITLLASQSSYAFFGLFGSDDEEESTPDVSQLMTSVMGESEASPLSSLLTDQLSVSTEQATGGVGALLSLASSSLSGSESSELSSLIPGMDSLTGGSAGGLMSMISSMDTVNQTFETLGLDSSMVSQFAPVILSYLTEQGASSGLLSSLTSLWQ
ncbi:hypothetical protein BCU68_14095 [Vibrio sp. 10N.286.49.B3]|uniref:DUF2780 domain-containing protein n=1 Tax=Vibrio sp. 10N.286.49.B3 TaxID=1880855 RepID=UPI000C8250A7|nr:DUF2780 domain-containing protein [Vibrio sp. 10N.286.49.B3]PMH42566.1 hypothetical protein BCU68_14095 [Vibrio sp. 10N.286.49.B3]